VTAAFGRFWPSAWEVGHPFPPTGPSISAVYANVEDALRLLPQKLHLQHAAGCGRCKGKGCVCVFGLGGCLLLCILRIECSVRHSHISHSLPIPTCHKYCSSVEPKMDFTLFLPFPFYAARKNPSENSDRPNSFKL